MLGSDNYYAFGCRPLTRTISRTASRTRTVQMCFLVKLTFLLFHLKPKEDLLCDILNVGNKKEQEY